MSKVYRRWEQVPSCVIFQRIPAIRGSFEDTRFYRRKVYQDGTTGDTVDYVTKEGGVWTYQGHRDCDFLPFNNHTIHYLVVEEVPMAIERALYLSGKFNGAIVDFLFTYKQIRIDNINEARNWTPIAHLMRVPLDEVYYLVQHIAKTQYSK